MNITKYKQAKNELKLISNWAKELHVDDKPIVRMLINDNCYYLCKEYNLSDKKQNLLHDYACVLHP